MTQTQKNNYNNEIAKTFHIIVIDSNKIESNEVETKVETNAPKYLLITLYILLSIFVVIYNPVFIIGVLLTIPFIFNYAPTLSEEEKQAIAERQRKSLELEKIKSNAANSNEEFELGRTSLKLGVNLLNLFILNK